MNTISLSAQAAHFTTVTHREFLKGKIFIEHSIIRDIIFIHKQTIVNENY